jgi:cytochrome c556
MRIAAVLVLAACAVAPVAAAKVDPNVAIPARQMGMKQVGRTFKGINDQLHSGAPDAAAVAAGAHQLADLARKVPSWFPAGSGPETGVKTSAKPEIWAQPADFRAKALTLANATAALDRAAAKSADPAVLQPFVAQVGGACKACHTAYKAPEH